MKNNNTKSIVLLITCILMGCSNATSQSEETTQPETQVTATEEPTEVEESEVVPEEVVAKEPEEVVTEEPTQPEEVEEPVATDEPVEVSIKEHADLTNYIATLDPDQPEIIIYNKFEMYMIHMKEGQHYQLKAEDEIIVNCEGTLIGYGWNIDFGDTARSIENYSILIGDYSIFENNPEFFLKKKLDNGDIVQRTCYFEPPTE